MADDMTTTCPMSEICAGRFSAIDARLDKMGEDVTDLKTSSAMMKQQMVDGFDALGKSITSLKYAIMGGNGNDPEHSVIGRLGKLEERKAEHHGVWLTLYAVASVTAFLIMAGIAMIEMFHHWGLK